MTDNEIAALIAPAPFSEGASREVFAVPGDPDVVVKRVKSYPGPNITEWMIWNAIQETDLEAIFGRCLSISITGRHLIMEKLSDTTVTHSGHFPRIPEWLTDRKRSAFGIDRNGTVKVRDYGSLKLGATLEMAPRVSLPL